MTVVVVISGAIEPGELHSARGKIVPAYFRWLSENEAKLICHIAIRSQRVEYEVLCTKAIAARRSTT